MTTTLCVKHREGWCALKEGTRLDPDAWSDQTACGYFVILRTGEEIREPTCPECKAKLGEKPPKGTL